MYTTVVLSLIDVTELLHRCLETQLSMGYTIAVAATVVAAVAAVCGIWLRIEATYMLAAAVRSPICSVLIRSEGMR
jgi:hypothetical protein